MAEQAASSAPLYCLCAVRTRRDAALARGATLLALAVCASVPCLSLFEAPLEAALEAAFDDPTPARVAATYELLASLDCAPIHALGRLERRLRRAVVPREGLSVGWVGDGGGRSGGGGGAPGLGASARAVIVPWSGTNSGVVSVPLDTEPEWVWRASLARLVGTFGLGVMAIYDAVLAGKRVLVMGDRGSAAGARARVATAHSSAHSVFVMGGGGCCGGGAYAQRTSASLSWRCRSCSRRYRACSSGSSRTRICRT
jgi:hypothetical protein